STAQYSQIRNISWSMGDLPWWFTTQGIVHFFTTALPQRLVSPSAQKTRGLGRYLYWQAGSMA
ncbi:MAG: hypothetical protein ACJ8AI_16340, partial [Rhodopila sp.]